MFSVNRQVAILKPREPFLEWLKTHNIFQKSSREDIEKDATVFLIPEFDFKQDSDNYIHSIFPDLFEMQLNEWNLDEELWPKNRNYDLFNKWFDLSYHSIVIDLSENDLNKKYLV